MVLLVLLGDGICGTSQVMEILGSYVGAGAVLGEVESVFAMGSESLLATWSLITSW